MTDFPRSLFEFQNRFGDERACATDLVAARWQDGFRCPAREHDKGWEVATTRGQSPAIYRSNWTLQYKSCNVQLHRRIWNLKGAINTLRVCRDRGKPPSPATQYYRYFF